MLKIIRAIGFSIILLISLAACADDKPLADVEFKDITGKITHLSDYKGKWVFINYWAGWCKPCFKEIPELNAFYKAHQNKDAVVLGVNFDQVPPKELKLLIKKMDIQFPSLTNDPAKILNLGDIGILPATFVISPEGKLAKVLMGEQTREGLEEAIRN